MNMKLQHSSTKIQSSKLPPFLETKRKILFKLSTSLRYHVGRKFLRNCCLCVFAFLAKIEKLKMAAIFGRNKIFEKWRQHIPQIPSGQKISKKSLYLERLRRQKHFCVFTFWRKFEMADIFGKKENFRKIGHRLLLTYHVGRKFLRNRSLCLCIFGENSKIQNGRHF